MPRLFRSLSSMPFRRFSTRTTSTSGSSSSNTTREQRATSTKSLLFFGTPVAATFALGLWQVKRLQRKQELIAERHERLFGRVLTETELYDDEGGKGEGVEFRSVGLRGVMRHDLEMLVSPRSAPPHLPPAVLQWGGSSGLQVVTPCELDSGHFVLVNRGWVPHRLRESDSRPAAAVSPLPFLTTSPRRESAFSENLGHVIEFQAVVRNQQERNRFMPNNNPKNNDWFYIDSEQMASYCNLSEKSPVIVELYQPMPQNGWPFPRDVQQFLEFRTPPSTHVTYATTWFSLSGALALLMRWRFRKGM